MNLEQKQQLVHKTLLPETILEDLAKQYGITKQRVGQIFKKQVGSSYSSIKQDLISEKFRCCICGQSLKVTGIKRFKAYCNNCKHIATKYDLTTERQCKLCLEFFFPLRNWKFIGAGDYCCTNHYLKYRNAKAAHDRLPKTE